jgi:hypothetical protein
MNLLLAMWSMGPRQFRITPCTLTFSRETQTSCDWYRPLRRFNKRTAGKVLILTLVAGRLSP